MVSSWSEGLYSKEETKRSGQRTHLLVRPEVARRNGSVSRFAPVPERALGSSYAGSALAEFAFETFPKEPGQSTMPRIFWTPTRDETLRTNYPVLGPIPTASLLGTSRRSVVNRAHRGW